MRFVDERRFWRFELLKETERFERRNKNDADCTSGTIFNFRFSLFATFLKNKKNKERPCEGHPEIRC